MRNNKTLILSKADIRKIADIKKAVKAVEDAFGAYARHQSQMPAKIYLDLKKFNGDFRAMPAYLDNIQSAALKWVNVHPDNRSKKLPTVMGVIILSDPKTGFPLCILDGTLLTSFRTAAAGGVAAKYLARKDSESVALVGCGEQARTQLIILRHLFKIKNVAVWGDNIHQTKDFIKRMRIKNEEMNSAKSVKECVSDADIIVTTTPSRKPLVKYAWLKAGVHINAIGADAKGKIELDPKVLKKAKVVIDDWAQSSHSGEINVALKKGIITKKDIYADIGSIVIGRKKPRSNNHEITVFDSTGLAIQDVAVAHSLYMSAKRKKVGRWINLV